MTEISGHAPKETRLAPELKPGQTQAFIRMPRLEQPNEPGRRDSERLPTGKEALTTLTNFVAKLNAEGFRIAGFHDEAIGEDSDGQPDIYNGGETVRFALIEKINKPEVQ